MPYRTHTCGELRSKHVGKEVMLSGWVHKRRDLGGVIFVDLRDRYGLTQAVFHPDHTKDFAVAEKLKYEYVIKVVGKVVKRDKIKVNKEIATGGIEVQVSAVEVLSAAKPLPFEIFDARKGEEEEELRLKFRFLELRREELKNNILFRARVVRYIRAYMETKGYIDIATPLLTVSSPEGARDYLVPSRLHPGKFYALPQAPQQYKQLLMVAGFDKYYQIAPCARDEDPRADRAPGEFYQLDVECSFLEPEEFWAEMEPLFIELTEKVAGKKVKQKPFPRIPYHDCLETYGSDRPDLRYSLTLSDVSAWAKRTEFNVFKQAEQVRALVVPGGAAFTRGELDKEFTAAAKRAQAKGLAWLKYQEGKWHDNIVKFFTDKQLTELHGLLGKPKVPVPNNAIVFFVADRWEVSCKALGAVRELAAKKQGLADPDVIAWAWITDFPMFEFDEKAGKVDFGHNPFSLPQGGREALETLDPMKIKAQQYDIIANGYELSSGAVRNKDPETMYKAFAIAGYSRDQVDKKFGHMIRAFEFGAPPHCGFAPGIERLVMVLLNEPNLRSVTAFPKNQKVEEPMMGSPSEVEDQQLAELGLRLAGRKGAK